MCGKPLVGWSFGRLGLPALDPEAENPTPVEESPPGALLAPLGSQVLAAWDWLTWPLAWLAWVAWIACWCACWLACWLARLDCWLVSTHNNQSCPSIISRPSLLPNSKMGMWMWVGKGHGMASGGDTQRVKSCIFFIMRHFIIYNLYFDIHYAPRATNLDRPGTQEWLWCTISSDVGHNLNWM